MVQEIGRATFKYAGSAVSYLNYYLFDFGNSVPVLKKLSVTSNSPLSGLRRLDRYVDIKWVDVSTDEKDLTNVYRQNIFNDILGGINRGANSCLYICIHFPFYKKAAFAHLSTLYKAITNASMPHKISFIGYCGDIAEMISPDEKNVEKLAPKAQAEAYKSFKEKNGVLINQRLVLFQNAFQNGIPLNLTNKSLSDTIALLLMQYSEHYDAIYPDTMTYSDATSFGISAISLDKYCFVDYVFCKAMLREMDSFGIMNDEISVNEVFAKAGAVLHEKDSILSKLIESGRKGNYDIVMAEKQIVQEADSIIKECRKILREDKSMTLRAAVLAALLQQKCDLFHQMVYNTDCSNLNDLYVAPINYFINNDKAKVYWKDDDTPLENPIPELKSVNIQLINTESQIRELEKITLDCEKQLSSTQEAGKVIAFSGDGYFHVNDKKYRLLPVTDEEPLQETYQSHAVNISSLDLSKNFREIQDQGGQGSCLAFALTSVFEYVMRINKRCEEIDLSEAFLYYNARKLDNENSVNEDSGLHFKPAIESLYKYGISVEALCRYDENSYDKEPPQAAYDDAGKRLLRKALNVSCSVNDVKSALADGYPVIGSFTLCPSFSNIVGGFVTMPTEEEIKALSSCGQGEVSKHSSHAMVIVGFDDNLQHFLVRNSWGTSWGDRGYCYMPYSYLETEGLCNFICILTEIESVGAFAFRSNDFPVLELDDTDVGIRYNKALIALRCENERVEVIKQKRITLLSQLEELKQKFSNNNECETYITKTHDKIKEEQNELEDKIRHERQWIAEEDDKYHDIKKILALKMAGYSASIWAIVWIYNKVIKFIADRDWIQSVVNSIDAALEYFSKWFLEKPKQFDVDLYVDWMHYVMIGLLLLWFLYKGSRAWSIWRNNTSEHVHQTEILERHIKEKQQEADCLRFNAQVACKWLIELNKIQANLQHRYTNLVSRINNLRSWYADINNAENSLNFLSEVPYTTLLDKDILDEFIKTRLSLGIEFDSFDDGTAQGGTAEAALKEYQEQLCNDVTLKLMENPRLKEFNVSEHIVTDAFTDIARKVVVRGDSDSVSLEHVKCQSDIFMHINSRQRGMIMPSTYIIAPSANDYRLRQKIKYGFDAYLPSSNPDCLVMLQIMCFNFDECMIFQ